MQEQKPTVIAPVKGKGTRLYPLTLYDSKSLVGIANQPALERIFENLALYGCRNFWIIGEYELYFYFRRGEGFSKRLNLKQRSYLIMLLKMILEMLMEQESFLKRKI